MVIGCKHGMANEYTESRHDCCTGSGFMYKWRTGANHIVQVGGMQEFFISGRMRHGYKQNTG